MIEEAQSQNANIWNIEYVYVFVPPETLSYTCFQRLLDEKKFHTTLSYTLIADKIHVLNTWGLSLNGLDGLVGASQRTLDL